MDNKEAIEHLDRVARSIEEVVWLIDISSDEVRSEPLSGSFKSRIGEILIDHLQETIEDVHYAQSLLRPFHGLDITCLDESEVLDDFMSSRPRG